jgi:flagellar hook-associated protein 3 FlgL
MRITNGYMSNNILSNLNENLENLNKYNEQLATGKKFNLPHQNPTGVASSMGLKTNIENNQQYMENIDNGISWLGSSDSAFDQADKIIKRTSELAVKAANTGGLSKQASQAIADEIKQLRESLVDVANTTYQGKYIFAGTKVLTKPYPDADSDYQGDGGSIKKEIAKDTEMSINKTGEFFKGLFDKMEDLIDNIEDGDGEAISKESLADLDQNLNDLLTIRSEFGAKQNRLEMTKGRLTDNDLQFRELLSKNEDVDIAETIMNLKMSENIYRSALSAGARIIQPSLMDFIK